MRFHIQQESDIPASTQLFNQICFAIAARHFPPGHRLPSTRQLAMQTGLHRNTISKVYRQLENDGVVEAMAGSGIYVRDQQKPRELKTPAGLRYKEHPDINREARQCVDGLLSAGCTLQQARQLLTAEIDWRLRCGTRVLVSTPQEDLGASRLIAEELGPNLQVPVEVVPLEDLQRVLESSHNGTVVTSRYFLQPVEQLARQHGVRAVAVDLNDFRDELTMLKQLRSGSCVGLVSISPGILRAAEVILHSMRGQELLVMTASPDVGSRLLALCRAAAHVLCDRPSLPLVEQTLRQNRAQLMRLPQVHCAHSYLGGQAIDLLKKEIGLVNASASA
ncbi:MAG: GntR family transcriptional regulator [Aphanocapsa feldmannii 277cV]|uniref:GntR family transcriptional regulator n=2 Tax=Aphanocapsa feldmannii TaxID=192050 RepID=A0A524RPY7_9CHRO|nr:MAG: GntR family transcriptional regulator [Aphanocapsa feldmannii 277cV]TGH27037.1 MAG: GntR family transcriptional regulator [Aphanocapsa feldmannii 277cI]